MLEIASRLNVLTLQLCTSIRVLLTIGLPCLRILWALGIVLTRRSLVGRFLANLIHRISADVNVTTNPATHLEHKILKMLNKI